MCCRQWKESAVSSPNNNNKSNNQTVYADADDKKNLTNTKISMLLFWVYKISQPWTHPPQIRECREIENLGKFRDFDLLQFCTCISLNASIKIVFSGCWLNKDLRKFENILKFIFLFDTAVYKMECVIVSTMKLEIYPKVIFNCDDFAINLIKEVRLHSV